MANGVLLHRMDSAYDDLPSSHYHFPKTYLSRVERLVGEWIVYYVPVKDTGTSKDRRGGYKAIAQIDRIESDDSKPGHYYARMVAGSYATFPNFVPMRHANGFFEKGLGNADGRVNSGYAVAAVRVVSPQEFNSIVHLGFAETVTELPRYEPDPLPEMREPQSEFIYDFDRQVVTSTQNRAIRDASFRRVVVTAYEKTCAITGLRLINGRGRAEVEAAHIRPVEHGGPDDVRNGIALSGTVHWMFDRGLIGLTDAGDILISRKVNDVSQVASLIKADRKASLPARPEQRPHPAFLHWHRDYHELEL